MVQNSISHYFKFISPSTSCIAAAADGNNLSFYGQGDLGPLSCVLISDNIRLSVSQRCDLGYNYAAEMCSVFPLKTRDSASILSLLHVFVMEILTSYGISMRH